MGEPTERVGGASLWGCLGISVGVALLFVLITAFRSSPAFQTKTAESITVELEDQSLVMLAPESALDLDFSVNLRAVELLRGQASFDILNDPERPFRITAGEYVVEALGASLDVYLEETTVTVAVEEGTVAVRSNRGNEPTRLIRGEALRGLHGGVIESATQRFDEMTAWRRGQVILREVPLIDAVDRLSPYLKAEVAIEGPQLREMRVSGAFNAAKPIVGLEAMASSVNAFLEKTSDTLITIRPR